MPGFDPNQFLADTAPAPSAGGFDPDKFLADTHAPVQAKAPPAAGENPHELVPFLKNTWQGVKNAADEFSSKPLPTIAYDHLVQPAVDTYQGAREKGEDPVNAGLSAAQTATGNAADTAKGFVTPELMPVEAYFRSRQNGNSAEDALKDARNVGLLVFGPKGVAKAVGTAGDMIGKAALKEAGVTPEQVARYKADPEAVNAAKPLVDQTKDFLDSVDTTRKGLSQASTASYDTLKGLGTTMKPEELTTPLSNAIEHIQKIGAYGPDRRSAIAYLNGLANDVTTDAGGSPLNLVSWDKGKNLIGVLDSKMESLPPGTDPQVLKAFGDARKSIDGYLKQTSPEYAQQMGKLAQDTQTYGHLADKFRTDTGAMNTLKRVQTGKDPFAADALGAYDQQFGTNFSEDLQNSAAKQAFDKRTTNGSRKAKIGAGTGGAIGATVGGLTFGTDGAVVGGHIGAAFGGVAGGLADQYGGAAVKAALDAGIKVNKLTGTKYAGVVLKAAQESPQRAAVVHYMLNSTDPAYQTLMRAADDQDDSTPAKHQPAE